MFTKQPARVGAAAHTGAERANGSAPRVPAARPLQAPSSAGPVSVIGPDLTITGNLECTGEVQIEGEVQGDIHATRIVVGAQAFVTGALVADEIVIGGNVQGSIRGNKVTFRTASRVECDVYHRMLTIEQGAYFEGKSRRAENPMTVPV